MLFDSIFSGSFSLSTAIISVISSLIVISLCLPFHEFSHAFIADKLGDQTARRMGRLTINPLAHIDYIGALMIILVGFGYAKPVPVNQFNLRNPKRDTALIALAGPVSNLILSFVLILLSNTVILLLKVAATYQAVKAIAFISGVLVYAAVINVYLAVFNLLPVPPLDGSRILFALAPDKVYYTMQKYEQYVTILLFVLIFSRVLSTPLEYVSGWLFNLIDAVASWPFSLIPA